MLGGEVIFVKDAGARARPASAPSSDRSARSLVKSAQQHRSHAHGWRGPTF